MTKTKTGKKPISNPVMTAFGVEREVILESGRKLLVPKWSVKKMIHMGTAISNIVSNLLNILKSRKSDEYEAAVKEALAKGLKNGDEGWPEEEAFNEADVGDFIVALPELMMRCADDLSIVIVESLTLQGGRQQLTKEQVFGDAEDALSIDEFPEVLQAIVETNLTEKTVKKWKNLLGSGMAAIPGLNTN